ncbi:hypothetical protein [Brasilonema sennae]|uniref:hypothetical protein n=1 Tax=Brasilonema sennae TaxID=1397703 RepID=UPI0030DCE55F
MDMGENPIREGQRDSLSDHVEVNHQSEAGNRAQSETSSVEVTLAQSLPGGVSPRRALR